MKRAAFVLPFAAILTTGCAHIIPSSPSPVPGVPFFMNSAGPIAAQEANLYRVLLYPSAVVLAVVKVALVVLYFMHLKFDRSIFALPFALGLVLMLPSILIITLTMNVVPFSSEAHALNNAGQIVDVREVSFRLHLSQDTVRAGPVTFHIVNGADDMLHEFIIVKTDLESTNLPLDPVTSRVNEDAIGIVASQDNIEPAHSRDLNVVLGEGHYVLICNLPGHYLQGMMVDFNVKGSSPVPTSESESTPSAPPAEQTPSGD